MNIKRAKQEIKNTIAAYLFKDAHGEYEIPPMQQRPLLLIGPPGIGKTQIMEQVARECRIALVSYTITHHTRQSAIGLPFISEKEFGGKKRHVTEYTMSEIVASVYERMEETGLTEGLLFIDEINCVSETLAPAMLQFLQYKSFGNHKIPDGWIIAAAGNPPEYNKSVREFDLATLDRVKKIEVEADFEVWKEYAKQVNLHPAILSYLTAKPEYVCRTETTVNGKRFATPRGWEDLSRFLGVYEKNNMEADREVIGQYLQHEKIARDFANYLELYKRYQAEYQLDEMLCGACSQGLLERAGRAEFDERLSIVSLLLSRLETAFKDVGQREEYLELLFEKLKEFQAESAGTAEGMLTPLMRFERLLEAFRSEHEKKKKAGLLTRAEDYRLRDVAETLNRCLQEAKAGSLTAWEPVFACFAERFDKERDRYEELCRNVLKKLEAAFDFMEGAFGDSQEMVIFITELNSSYYAVRFLEEYDCERYYRYNKRLLFEEREKGLKSRLERLGF
ncbi:MAG: AAA family ATPase [Lachnospiraceae bacterium]|nr:AAA family ATPase [Lachnospiraceae bacterium]